MIALSLSALILVKQIPALSYVYLALIIISSLVLGALIAYWASISRLERLSKLSSTDITTGLYGSQVINKLLTYDIERSRRYKRDLSVVLIDLDNFSELNDIHGSKKADYVLKKLSDIITQGIEYMDEKKKEFHGIRNSDIAFRYEAEDKILIIMPETNAKGAYIAAERLREAVMFTPFNEENEEKNSTSNSTPIRITLSAAVVSFNNKSDVVESLLERAELLLLKAKITKNHVVIENPIHNGIAVNDEDEIEEEIVAEYEN